MPGFGVVVAAAATSAFPALTQPQIAPTAREMYVACTLFVRDAELEVGPPGTMAKVAPTRCAMAGLSAVTFAEGHQPDRKYNFCLPKTAEMEAGRLRAMAIAYLDYFERRGAMANPGGDGIAAFTLAQVHRWPCPSSR